jgi:cell wall-associated NlpC family hydrolase
MVTLEQVPWKPTKAAHLLVLAQPEVGKPYLMGSEGSVHVLLPTWDCSELVQHLLAIVGVEEVTDDSDPPRRTPIGAFDGAGFQWERSHHIPLREGIQTPGALLFIQNRTVYADKPHGIGHVAISLGNGFLIEARGKAYGVTIGPVRGTFTLASKARELYTPAVLA